MGPGRMVPPKIEHLNLWWQPSFYPAFYFNFVIAYLYFLISLFSISLNNWKMTILIVYLSLTCIYSITLLWSLYWTKYVFIYLKEATKRSSIKSYISSTLALKKLKYACACFVFLKVARPETVLKLDFFTGKLDTL